MHGVLCASIGSPPIGSLGLARIPIATILVRFIEDLFISLHRKEELAAGAIIHLMDSLLFLNAWFRIATTRLANCRENVSSFELGLLYAKVLNS